MRKEVLFAIISGIIFGLVIAFGVWRANLAIKKQQASKSISTENLEVEKNDTLAVNQNNNPAISFIKPEPFDVLAKSPTIVSGITKENSWIVLTGGDTQYVSKTTPGGAFEIEFDLESGINNLDFFSVNFNEKPSSANLTVVYSTEFDTSENPNDQATDSAKIIEQNVEKKLETAKNKPKAYIGTITDITNNSLQIKGEEDEIMQISIEEGSTSFVKTTTTTTKIKKTDLALGDYIAALGYIDGDNVLDAKRIIVSTPPDNSETLVIFGTVTATKTSEISVSYLDKNYKIKTAKNALITQGEQDKRKTVKFSSIDQDYQIIAVGTLEGDLLTASRIHIVLAPPTPTSEN